MNEKRANLNYEKRIIEDTNKTEKPHDTRARPLRKFDPRNELVVANRIVLNTVENENVYFVTNQT